MGGSDGVFVGTVAIDFGLGLGASTGSDSGDETTTGAGSSGRATGACVVGGASVTVVSWTMVRSLGRGRGAGMIASFSLGAAGLGAAGLGAAGLGAAGLGAAGLGAAGLGAAGLGAAGLGAAGFCSSTGLDGVGSIFMSVSTSFL